MKTKTVKKVPDLLLLLSPLLLLSTAVTPPAARARLAPLPTGLSLAPLLLLAILFGASRFCVTPHHTTPPYTLYQSGLTAPCCVVSRMAQNSPLSCHLIAATLTSQPAQNQSPAGACSSGAARQCRCVSLAGKRGEVQGGGEVQGE